jgi:O-methyltransferase involved in polyketide biosynthesis
MSEATAQSLSDVAETLPITLYIRAMESQRPDALIRDEKAVALVTRLDYDFSRIKQMWMDEEDSACSTNGFLSAGPNHASRTFDGCDMSHSLPGQWVFSTTGLERR